MLIFIGKGDDLMVPSYVAPFFGRAAGAAAAIARTAVPRMVTASVRVISSPLLDLARAVWQSGCPPARCRLKEAVRSGCDGRVAGARPEAVEIGLPTRRDGVRREADEQHGRGRAWLRVQRHRHLLEQPVALAQVAGRARGDDVLPLRPAALRARDDVIERKAAARLAAVDAFPAVAREERAPRDLALDDPRHANVGEEANDVRPGVGVR